MPNPNVNQRAAVAELAAEIGWIPREFTQTSEFSRKHTIYCVQFIHPHSDATIKVEYSFLDKIVQATRQRSENGVLLKPVVSHRATTVYAWLRDVRRVEPEEVFEAHDYGTHITITKPGEDVATVCLHRYCCSHSANWYRITHKHSGRLSVDVGKDQPRANQERIRKLAIEVGLTVAKFNFDDKEL